MNWYNHRLVVMLSHRLLLPVVCLLFLISYIALAFFTDEALVTLVQLAGHNPFALGLLVLIAASSSLRLVSDLNNYRTSCRQIAGKAPVQADTAGAWTLAVNGQLEVDEVGRILAGTGYQLTVREGFVAGVRGVSLICPRLLWRLTLVLLFAGLAISLSTRSSLRIPVIEGEALPVEAGAQRKVVRIALEDTPRHWFLQRRLTITLADDAGRPSTFGIYPPGLVNGRFLYPRYPAVAPLLRFSVPGETRVLEGYQLIMLYPPGREDTVDLGNGYRAQLVIPQQEGMPDPFVSGRFDLHVKLTKGDQVLAEGEVPFGGSFAANGFSVALLDAKRYVVSDFLRDVGVFFIWLAAATALAAVLLYLPIRCFWPRRLMVFTGDGAARRVVASCSAEGKRRGHEALFHDLLDRICRDR